MQHNLKWLSSTTFLADFNKEFKVESIKAYNRISSKWYQQVKKNNTKLEEILDQYFDTIYIIITENDKVVLPTKMSKN